MPVFTVLFIIDAGNKSVKQFQIVLPVPDHTVRAPLKFRYNSARKCISGMLCASLIILLVNNLFSQFLGAYLSYFNFMYYLYAFSGYNGAELTGKITLSGVLVNLITGTLFIYDIRRRTDRMIL